MHLFDTPTQRTVELRLGKAVNIYVCGITPYDAAHAGHIFTFMAYDLLARRLEDTGHTVRLVRNVTDVDEPIFKRAAELGESYLELARRETLHLHEILETMNFRPLHAEPLATQYIGQMAAAVKKLLRKGIAYQLEDDIYFDVGMFPKFGGFSGFSDRLQLGFMQDRGGDPRRPGKRQPLDFLLWRGITDPTDPAAWDTVVGHGRPGWHIECTVMSAETLGTPIDIHGGGMDLIFPHHECEVAQSTALGHQPFANHWMHVAPILYQGEKMSKSLGNLVFARDMLKYHRPGVVRLALMQLHYRTGGEWRHDALVCAEELYDLLLDALAQPQQLSGDNYLEQVRAALDDDLDTHQVLHVLRDACAATLAQNQTDKSGKSDIPETTPSQLQQISDLIGLPKIPTIQ